MRMISSLFLIRQCFQNGLFLILGIHQVDFSFLLTLSFLVILFRVKSFVTSSSRPLFPLSINQSLPSQLSPSPYPFLPLSVKKSLSSQLSHSPYSFLPLLVNQYLSSQYQSINTCTFPLPTLSSSSPFTISQWIPLLPTLFLSLSPPPTINQPILASPPNSLPHLTVA